MYFANFDSFSFVCILEFCIIDYTIEMCVFCHSKFHILAQIVFLAASGLEAIGLMFVCPPAIGPVLIRGRKFSNMSDVQLWCFQ